MDTRLDLAIKAINDKEFIRARDLLIRVISDDNKNDFAWYWLSKAVTSEKESIFCLKHALRINPNNTAAKRELDEIKLKSMAPDLASEQTQPGPREMPDKSVNRNEELSLTKEGDKTLEFSQKINLIEQESDARQALIDAILAFIGAVVSLGFLIFGWEELGDYVVQLKCFEIPLFGARLGVFLFAIYAAYKGFGKYSDYRDYQNYIKKYKKDSGSGLSIATIQNSLKFIYPTLKGQSETAGEFSELVKQLKREKLFSWILVLTLMWIIGWRLFLWAGGISSNTVAFLLSFGVFGFVIGVGQGFLLKHDIPFNRWVIASTLGGLISGLLILLVDPISYMQSFIYDISNNPDRVALIIIGLILAGIISLVQYLFLRDRFQSGFLWIISSSLGWSLGIFISWNPDWYSDPSFFENILRELVGGVNFALVTGSVMVYRVGLWMDNVGPRQRFHSWRTRQAIETLEKSEEALISNKAKDTLRDSLVVVVSILEPIVKLFGGILNFLLGIYVIGAIIAFFIIQHDCSGGFEPSYYKIVVQALLWPFTILGFGRTGYWSMECY